MTTAELSADLFTGNSTFAEFSRAKSRGGYKPQLNPVDPDAERDRIKSYSVRSVLEQYKSGRWSSGVVAGKPPQDRGVVMVATNPEKGANADFWREGWGWAREWGAEKWGEIKEANE